VKLKIQQQTTLFCVSNAKFLNILYTIKSPLLAHKKAPFYADFQSSLKSTILQTPPHQIDRHNPFDDTTTPWQLLNTCILENAQSVLAWYGAPIIKKETLLTFQEITKSILIDQLWAGCLAEHIVNNPHSEAHLNQWVQTPLFPKTDHLSVNHLSQKGFVDLHQHFYASTLPSNVWSQALKNPKALISKKYDFPDDKMNLPSGMNITHFYYHLRTVRIFRRLLIDTIEEPKETTEEPKQTTEEPKETTDEAKYIALLQFIYDEMDYPEEPEVSYLDAFHPEDYKNERYFLVKAFLYLGGFSKQQDPSQTDLLFYWMLHDYLLIQNLYLQSFVQQDIHFGFDEFSKFERSVTLQNYKQEIFERVFDQYQHEHHLKAIELRITPKTSIKGLLNNALLQRLMHKPGRSAPKVQKGIIYHCIKIPDKDDKRFASKTDTQPDDRIGPLIPILCRHHRLRQTVFKETRAIVFAKEKSKKYAKLLIGIDAANDELFTRPEVFAPHFRWARDRYASIVHNPEFDIGTIKPYQTISAPLQITFHAGESFDHVLSGLRYVDEAIEFCEMRSGDRIGHGLAMGIDIQNWCEMLEADLSLSQGTWLDNVVWMKQVLSADNTVGQNVMRYLDQTIAHLSRVIYQVSINDIELHDAWKFRSEEPSTAIRSLEAFFETSLKKKCESLNAPADSDTPLEKKCVLLNASTNSSTPNAYDIWQTYHFDATSRYHYAQTYTLNIDASLKHNWIHALEKCQQFMIRKLVDKQIAIEVNPTSNLRIGSFYRMEEHPIFKWHPICPKDGQIIPDLTINADNYSVFQTTLPLEYAYLAQAAKNLGHSENDIEHWLDTLRANGFKYSFINNLKY